MEDQDEKRKAMLLAFERLRNNPIKKRESFIEGMSDLKASNPKMAESELLKKNGLTTRVKGTTEKIIEAPQKILTTTESNIEKELLADLKKAITIGDKEQISSIGKKAKKLGILDKIIQKSPSATKAAQESDRLFDAAKKLSKAGKKGLKTLIPGAGLFGAGLSAMLGSDSASAGEIIADEGTDLIPGVGMAKMALSSDEVGRGSDIIPENAEMFSQTPEEQEKIKRALDAMTNKYRGQ